MLAISSPGGSWTELINSLYIHSTHSIALIAVARHDTCAFGGHANMQSVLKSKAVQFVKNHIIVYLFVFSYCVVDVT